MLLKLFPHFYHWIIHNAVIMSRLAAITVSMLGSTGDRVVHIGFGCQANGLPKVAAHRQAATQNIVLKMAKTTLFPII